MDVKRGTSQAELFEDHQDYERKKQGENKDMIYVYAPFYNYKSNGIAVIYELVKILNRHGLESRILCFENERYDFEIPEDIKPYYISKAQIPKAVSDRDVVIYIETAAKNVLAAKNSVCWLLNKPGVLMGDQITFQPNCVLVAYSTLIHDKLPQLFIMRDERTLFKRIRNTCNRKEDTVSVYFGKVKYSTVVEKNEQLDRLLKKYKKVNVITRLSPMEREKTLKQIAQSDLLISYDSLSNINYEATLVGTPTLMMDDSYNIGNTAYNVGKYGFAFEEKEIEIARKEVAQAFEIYCEWLKNQDNSVVESVQQILKQIEGINSDSQALQQNAKTNKEAEETFSDFYKAVKEPFINIDFPYQIPAETKRIVGVGEVSSTLKPMIENIGNYKTSGLFGMYKRMKPKWIEAAYIKNPGDLRVRELFFFMVRRLTLIFKKK